MRLYPQQNNYIHPKLAVKYEDDAERYWDLFYKRNKDRFFKDRHYLDKEWPQLTQGSLTVLEVGCGAGNTVFPLLELNTQLYVYACDFSPRAVELVKTHPDYAATGRASAFVADITQDEGPGALKSHLPGACVDFCSMVFVLSAVAPHKMRQALRNIASVLKPGSGRVLFRDYAEGDLAQARLDGSQEAKQIVGSFYARGDGTCCYYFGQEELSNLFKLEGFVCETSIVHARTIENRKLGVQMPRRWLQAVFRYEPHLQQQQQRQHTLEQPPRQPPLQPHQRLEPAGHQRAGLACKLQHEQVTAAAEVDLLQQPRLPEQQERLQQSCTRQSHTHRSLPWCEVQQADNRSSSSTGGQSTFCCAGKQWKLPPDLGAGMASSSNSEHVACGQGGSSSSGSSRGAAGSCCAASDNIQGDSTAAASAGLTVAQALLRLLDEEALPLTSSCVLITPPGVCVNPEEQQGLPQSSTQPRLSAQVAQQGTSSVLGMCSTLLQLHSKMQGENWKSSCQHVTGCLSPTQQGSVVAILALVLVWLGVRRVYVCLPDVCEVGLAAYFSSGVEHCDGQVVPQASNAVLGGGHCHSASSAEKLYELSFHSTMALNECSVVVERVRPVVWSHHNKGSFHDLLHELSGSMAVGYCGSMLLTLCQCCSSADNARMDEATTA